MYNSKDISPYAVCFRTLSEASIMKRKKKKKKKKKKEKKDSRKTQDKTETEPFSASAKGKRQKIHVLNTRSCPNRPNQTKPNQKTSGAAGTD
jgi:hypothetical protein